MPKMSANLYIIEDYENETAFRTKKTNPIKPNFHKAKMNVNSFITKDYKRNDAFAVQKNKPNSNPISSKAKMNKIDRLLTSLAKNLATPGILVA